MSDSKKEADVLPEIVLENTQEDTTLKEVYETLDFKVDKILDIICRRELKRKTS
jgi:hypothetical protein